MSSAAAFLPKELLFLETIFDDDATLGDLLRLVGFLGILILVGLEACRPILSGIANGPLKPTLSAIAELEIDKQGGDTATKEEYLELVIVQNWPETMMGLGLHTLGGCLNIPSVYGWTMVSKRVSSSLACFGIILEMAYGVRALFRLLYFRLVREPATAATATALYPTQEVLWTVLRHSLACVMGIPMILWYRHNPDMHRICYYMRFSVAAIGCITEYSRSLDTTKIDELFRFMLLSFVMFLIILWTRVVQWLFLSYKLVKAVYADEHWGLLVFGGLFLVVFTAFNIFSAVIPTYQRLVALWKILAAYGDGISSESSSGSSSSRRMSYSEIQAAAAELMATETKFYESAFEDRRVAARHSFIAKPKAPRFKLKDYIPSSMVHMTDLPSDRLRKMKETIDEDGGDDNDKRKSE
jgi:hypothetical protein